MLAALRKYAKFQPISGYNERHLNLVMQRKGFRPGAPTPEAAEIDSKVATRQPCNECGKVHTRYLPFVKDDRYKAFIICDDCRYYEEF